MSDTNEGEPMTVSDAKGRVFHITTLTPDKMLDLYEAAEDASGNASWMRYAMVVASVSQIDDGGRSIPLMFPRKKMHVRANAADIGNDGMVALMRAMFPQAMEEDVSSTAGTQTVAP